MRLTGAALPEALRAAGFRPLPGQENTADTRQSVPDSYLAYLPATRQPLCADVGLIARPEGWVLYDVGQGAAAQAAVRTVCAALPGKGQAVLSHFHPDHCGGLSGWAELPVPVTLWQTGLTAKHTGLPGNFPAQGAAPLLQDVTVLAMPSSHAKGSLALLAGAYLFVGDALYPGTRQGCACYNVSLVAQQLRLLRQCGASYCLISHKKRYCYPMPTVLSWLQRIYACRKPGEGYLFLPSGE